MTEALTFRPVTAETVTDFEKLFAARGSPNWCWCMAWRATPAEIKNSKSPARRAQILARIGDGVPVGLLAYDGNEPIAWVSVAPKSTFRSLGGTEDDDGVWSLTCMFVPRARRGTGLSARLIEAAVDHARQQGARLLEAYPVDPDSPSYRHMGFVEAFERLGFTPAGMAGSRRHVMHRSL
jgi:GNAT superfamily N-acetyltransferase